MKQEIQAKPRIKKVTLICDTLSFQYKNSKRRQDNTTILRTTDHQSLRKKKTTQIQPKSSKPQAKSVKKEAAVTPL